MTGGLACCGCCVLKCVVRMIFSVVLIVFVIAFIVWLIFRPNLVTFHATGASLARFDFTRNSTLNYHLALNVTVRNPNRRVGVYYDRIEARPLYDAQRLDSKTLTPFFQGFKNTTTMPASFSGHRVVLLGGDALKEFHKEKAAGVYDIDVKLFLRLRLKYHFFKSPHFKQRIHCGLKVPLNSSSVAFARTACDFDSYYIFKHFL